jgi:ubiquinone/menaquinone biosynthesis C-methylase UbiE
MAGDVCPWWLGYFIDNPVRRLLHDPSKILRPYLKPGMTVMDIGCGMGIFSIAMAKMVSKEGRVIAVDLQARMLDTLRKRAQKAGVTERIQSHQCGPNALGIDVQVDFVLAFAVVHEVPDTRRLLGEVRANLRPGGTFFVAEPRLHVPAEQFQGMVKLAEELGLRLTEEPRVRLCRAAVFARE